MTRQEATELLIRSYEAYFNITRYDEEELPLCASMDFFEHSQKYVLSKKAELWSSDSEEFAYLFSMEHLDLETFNKCKEYAYQEGMKKLNIGPGHMYSYITAIFLCDNADEDALKALRKTRIYKSFHFSFHGWMDFHTAVAVLGDKGLAVANSSGRQNAKILKKILFTKKKNEREK